jgi:hypothetical protein
MYRSDSIEMGDANFDTQMFLQPFLKMRTCRLWSRTTALGEPLEDRLTHFGRMSMPSIVESSFPLATVGGKPSVRCGPASLHACSPGRARMRSMGACTGSRNEEEMDPINPVLCGTSHSHPLGNQRTH